MSVTQLVFVFVLIVYLSGGGRVGRREPEFVSLVLCPQFVRCLVFVFGHRFLNSSDKSPTHSVPDFQLIPVFE